MKLVIDIDENLYKVVQNEVKGKVNVSNVWTAIANGTPYEERPQGEWEENENGTGICSNCYEGIYYRTPTGRAYIMLKEQIVKFGYKYCPNCGAKMRGGAE